MRTLAQILADHAAWHLDSTTGRRLVWHDLKPAERVLFRGANLSRENLHSADLSGADLREANLGGTNLGGTNMHMADLRGANMSRTYLRGAYLQGARGIVSFLSPTTGRVCFAVAGDPPMIQLGCWWGDVADTIARIRKVHGATEAADLYVAQVELAARIAQHTSTEGRGE